MHSKCGMTIPYISSSLHNAKGYVVMGSNGEAVSLDTQEKVELCKAVREMSKPSHLIIAGTGCHGKLSPFHTSTLQ